MAEQITVYTTGPSCARCTLTKKVLTSKGIEYDEVNIRDNKDARAYVVDDLGYTKAPAVVVTEELGELSPGRPHDRPVIEWRDKWTIEMFH